MGQCLQQVVQTGAIIRIAELIGFPQFDQDGP